MEDQKIMKESLIKLDGPSIFSLFTNITKIKTDVLNFGEELILKYGNKVKIQVGSMSVIAFNEAKFHKLIMKDLYLKFPKSKAYDKMSPVLGEGLLIAKNEFWRQNRKIVAPAFSHNKLKDYFEDIKAATQNLFIDYEKDPHRNFHDDMMKLALSAITRSLFKKDYSEESEKIGECIHDFMTGMEDRIFQILPFSHLLPTKKNKKFNDAIEFLNSIIFKIIKERREDPNKDDMISLLITASNRKEATGITDNYLRDEIMTFFVAGHETSANALSWALYLIITHKKWHDKIKEEIELKIKSKNFDYNELEDLPILEACINESLRLLPPVWINSREAGEDIVVENIFIKKDTIIVLSPYFLHRNPEYFENPSEFLPERFLENKIIPDTFLPFGIGPRSCIGEFFARMEIKTILIMLLQNFNIKIDETHKVIPLASVTLRPKNGIKFYFEKRN